MLDTPNAIRGGAHRDTARPARAKVATMVALALSVASFAVDALPVIPQAVGFGMDTPAGRGGTVHRVTNLNQTGAGSLRACVEASGPRVCVFEVSGTIRMTSDLSIRNPYITIAGQTAPSPGIMLRGGAIRVRTSNVLVQHLRIRAGDDATGPAIANRDSFMIGGEDGTTVSNIVVDHCSIGWGMDETVSLWSRWDNVTFRSTIISEGLREHADGNKAGYGLLAGGEAAGRLTLVGNLFAHNGARNPLARARQLVFVNNVVYNFLSPSVDLQSEFGIVSSNSVVGNVFIPGADAWDNYHTVEVRTGGMGLPETAKVYVNDNENAGSIPQDGWSIANSNFSTSIKATSPPAWPTGLVRLPASGNTVLNEVLQSAGARPADRDSVDTRVVRSVRDRTGRIINCVSADGSSRCSRNAGGWPTLAENRRTLTLPADYNQVQASGYTRLETWLQQMAAEVEGRSTFPPAAPRLIE
jgi:hypothetical protein